jgi:hypothetical protein
MEKLRELIAKKPRLFVGVTVGYLIVLAILKWKLHPQLSLLWYLGGGVLGIYFLDAAELFFSLSPSPFRSIFFSALFAVVSFFIVSSSGSALATGLVISLYLQLLMWQIGEWEVTHTFTSWYRMVAVPVDMSTKRWIFGVFLGVFLFESYWFIH